MRCRIVSHGALATAANVGMPLLPGTRGTRSRQPESRLVAFSLTHAVDDLGGRAPFQKRDEDDASPM